MIEPILTVLIVGAAVAWLLRRTYLTFRAASRGDMGALSRCSSCHRNPANAQANAQGAVIQLGTTRPTSANQADAR